MKYLITSFITLLFAASALAQETYVTVDGFPACKQKSDLDKLKKYAEAQDRAAFDGMIDGVRCIVLKGGIEVQRMNVTWGGTEIRPLGVEDTVWTLTDGITKK